MKKLITTLTFLLVSFVASAQVNLFEGTFDEALVEAKKTGKLILLNCTS